MTDRKCWICKKQSKYMEVDSVLHYNCSRCGNYTAARELTKDYEFNDLRLIANASGWLRENQNFFINDITAFHRLNSLLVPSVNERVNKFLTWLDRQTHHLGQHVPINITEEKLWTIAWVMNKKEIEYLIQYLQDQKLIKKIGQSGEVQFSIEILPTGFAYLDDLNKKIQSDIGFCAMSFDSELLPVWNEAISPAIIAAGYDPVRIDSQLYNTGIVDHIKTKIRQAKFVIADLTMHKHGVYYEAGFADGLGRDVIFTCREDKFDKKHFDVQHINIIKWSLNQRDDFKKLLHWRIEGTLGRGKKL